MNATPLQRLIASLPCGFITDKATLQKIIELDRLQLVLARCGCGRFLAPAQDVEHFTHIIARDKGPNPDYVRDLSIPSEDYLKAVEAVKASGPAEPVTVKTWNLDKTEPVKVDFHPKALQLPPYFNEGDCGGVFDGFSVTSDADPGL